MTLAAFAQSIGIGMSTLTAYEAGKREPNAKTIAAVKELYGVELDTTAAPAPKEKAAPAKKAAAAPAKKAAAAPAKKPAAKKDAKAVVIIQSPMGGEITPEEILKRVGDVDKVYVRIDQNAAYWIKGEESGAINLW
jgi:transcriptional regulator with XRE-family HTH domain